MRNTLSKNLFYSVAILVFSLFKSRKSKTKIEFGKAPYEKPRQSFRIHGALLASCGETSSDSHDRIASEPLPPPPPPLPLLSPPKTLREVNYLQADHLGRVRSFPHVDGNYALHVFIPVYIPCSPKKELTQFLKKVMCLVPGLHVVNIDEPLNTLCKDDHKFEQVALGREFHISLGRTVPIRKHQIDSVVTMLRQKLQFQRRYCIDFNKWEVFVNDNRTRTFLSIEVTAGGLAEIRLQIQAVNEVYRLHNLPEFYKDPCPHVSLVWALGDISDYLKRVMEDMKRQNNVEGSQRRIWTSKFNGIKCKIGKKTYKICKFQEEL